MKKFKAKLKAARIKLESKLRKAKEKLRKSPKWKSPNKRISTEKKKMKNKRTNEDKSKENKPKEENQKTFENKTNVTDAQNDIKKKKVEIIKENMKKGMDNSLEPQDRVISYLANKFRNAQQTNGVVVEQPRVKKKKVKKVNISARPKEISKKKKLKKLKNKIKSKFKKAKKKIKNAFKKKKTRSTAAPTEMSSKLFSRHARDVSKEGGTKVQDRTDALSDVKINSDDTPKLKGKGDVKKNITNKPNNQTHGNSGENKDLQRSDRIISFLANQFKNPKRNSTFTKKPEKTKDKKEKTFDISSHKKDTLKIDPTRKKVKSKSKDVQKKKKSSKGKEKSPKMKTEKSKGSGEFSVGVGGGAISQLTRKLRGIKLHIFDDVDCFFYRVKGKFRSE